LKADLSDMPVMMPGSAIGRINRSDIASLPKKRSRANTAAAAVPRTSARNVAKTATRSDSQSAFQIAGIDSSSPRW
jgi:hypothetical protein